MNNSDYALIARIDIPYHEEDDAHFRTLYVYDVTDEKDTELFCVDHDWEANEIIKSDLELVDEHNVCPGSLFHRYDVRYEYPHTVYVVETAAYNV